MSNNKIKLVVEVDEYCRDAIIRHRNGTYGAQLPYYIVSSAFEAIANGTPLPKEHGRLIEEPTERDISNTVGGNNDFAECIRDSVKTVFDNATTIIEADKG